MSGGFFSTLSKNAVYTGMRTMARHTSIFQLDRHMERLAQQPLVMTTAGDDDGDNNDGGDDDKRQPLDIEQVRKLVLPQLCEHVEAFERANPTSRDDGGELKIVVALDTGMQVKVSVSQLPPVKHDPVAVELVVAHREQATLKTAQWEKKRRQFLEAKRSESNEVLLTDQDQRIFEGLSSNFFVLLKNGSVQMAPEDSVLLGTTMAMLLKMWQRTGRTVDFRLPCLAERHSWEGCFVCSTSRLVLPVSSIHHLGGDFVCSFECTEPMKQLIQGAVQENENFGVPFRNQ